VIKRHRLINTFKQLVRLDSLSLHEAEIIRYLKKQLKGLALNNYEAGRPKEGEVGSLIVEVPASGVKEPRLLLNAHLDTVSPGENVRPLQKDGYLTSDGKTILGADDKAGVAVILEILRVLKEKKLPHPPLLVILTVAEEIGLVGARALPENLLDADFGVTLDGGDINKIINRAPSQCNLTVKVFGKAAHAGIHPEEGINAIKVASEAISKMKLGRIDAETTANIGLIKGGRATNIIPEEVEIKGEARSHNLKKLERQLEHMEEILVATCRKQRARVELKFAEVYEAFSIPPASQILKFAFCAAAKAGIKPKLVATGGGSDANIFNACGIPTIIMGVGADRVHTTSERIAVKELVKGAELILTLVKECVKWEKLREKKQ
jgi:tripeptide aminopeptidase